MKTIRVPDLKRADLPLKVTDANGNEIAVIVDSVTFDSLGKSFTLATSAQIISLMCHPPFDPGAHRRGLEEKAEKLRVKIANNKQDNSDTEKPNDGDTRQPVRDTANDRTAAAKPAESRSGTPTRRTEPDPV